MESGFIVADSLLEFPLFLVRVSQSSVSACLRRAQSHNTIEQCEPQLRHNRLFRAAMDLLCTSAVKFSAGDREEILKFFGDETKGLAGFRVLLPGEPRFDHGEALLGGISVPGYECLHFLHAILGQKRSELLIESVDVKSLSRRCRQTKDPQEGQQHEHYARKSHISSPSSIVTELYAGRP